MSKRSLSRYKYNLSKISFFIFMKKNKSKKQQNKDKKVSTEKNEKVYIKDYFVAGCNVNYS